MNTQNKTLATDFLKSINIGNLDILDYIDIDLIDTQNAFYSIYEMIEDNRGFDIEIVYYASAINYLKENDPSLNECLEIASEYGYELKNLNSEILASLLASQNVRDDFSDYRNEIDNFFITL